MNLPELAKKTVESYTREGKIIQVPEDLSEKYKKEKAGVFVTIEKRGELRACIGTYLPLKGSIAREVIQNAISATTEDYRFGPIKKTELSQLSYTVYVLEKPERIASFSQLNPERYGVIVKSGPKTGLLLPGLKDIKNTEEQIFFACQKAKINTREENLEIYRFSAKKHR